MVFVRPIISWKVEVLFRQLESSKLFANRPGRLAKFLIYIKRNHFHFFRRGAVLFKDGLLCVVRQCEQHVSMHGGWPIRFFSPIEHCLFKEVRVEFVLHIGHHHCGGNAYEQGFQHKQRTK